jgi:uncharacterized protein YbjT (DUF2867 family)
MVGQGALRECLLDPAVERVLAVGRAKGGTEHPKLRELVHSNLFDLAPIEAELTGYDACFFCLGVSSAGMSEAEYKKITFDLTLAVATTLARLNPAMTFEYVSGAGTDSTAKGSSMWARVKGATENALLALPFKEAYMLRPGFIQPKHGIKSKTTLHRVLYAMTTPLYPVMKGILPGLTTTSELLGRAMLVVAKKGASKKVLETRDLNALAEGEASSAPH